MHKKRWIFCVLSILLVSSLSCYDENSNFGKNLVESVFTNVRTDTNTVLVTLMKMDSMETSGTGTVIAGVYNHPIWGEIRAESYLPFARPSYATDKETRVMYDSLTFNVTLNTNFIGDTLPEYTFYLHRLTQKVKLDDDGYLFNTSTFPYEDIPTASATFRPQPNRQNQISFRLDDDFGREILELFHSRSETVSAERFEDYFKGFVMIPDDNNTSLLSYVMNDTSTVMTLHYHARDNSATELTMRASVNTSTQFNHFTHDRNGTILEDINMKKVEVSSSDLDNKGMLFGGLGWYCRLDFPHINNLLWTGEQIEIEGAYLKFYPVLGTYSDLNQLPDSIYLYIADPNNVITDVVSDYLGSEVQIATLNDNRDKPNQVYYYFDISSFIQQELGTIGNNKHNLQLVFNSTTYTSTFRNLTFDDQNGENPLTLDIIYKVYEKY